MITGNPMKRDGKAPDPNNVESWALTFRCWSDTDFNGPSNRYPPGAGSYDTVYLPKQPCNGGIRANIFFPTFASLFNSHCGHY